MNKYESHWFIKPKCKIYNWVKSLLLKKLCLPERIRFLFPAEARYISVLQNIQAAPGVYLVPYSVGIFEGKAAKA